MVSKVTSAWFVLMMVLSASIGNAQAPTAEDLDTRVLPLLKRFDDLAALKADRNTADQAEQKVRAQLKASPKDAALQQAVAAAQANTQAKNAAFEKAARDPGLRTATAAVARQVVLASPKDGTLAVLRTIDKPGVQAFAQGPSAPVVTGFQSGLASATTPDNATAVRAAVEQYCGDCGDTPAASWAAKTLYWKAGADSLPTLQATELAKPLREAASARYVDELLTKARGAVAISALDAAVGTVPDDFRTQVKRMILADARSMPDKDQKDAYLAFMADYPQRADLKFVYFVKIKATADLKAMILERAAFAPSNFSQDMAKPGVLRVLSADDVAELDATAQGQAASLVQDIVLRHSAHGDPVRITAMGAQAYAEECKYAFRAADGRITRESVRAVLDHVVDGKGDLPVPVSDTAKAFGTKLPDGTYPAMMFRGDFMAAAQLAHGQLKAAKTDTEYLQAVARLRQAVQCLDRCYNGRSLDVIKWLNGQLDTCPVPELVKQ